MFERLPTVPRSQELIDKAFRRASKVGMTPGNDESVVQTAGNVLSDGLSNLVRKFPSFENLPPFYRELVDILVGIDEIRVRLSKVHWAARQVKTITREYIMRIKRGKSTPLTARKEAFGRMASVIKSVDKDLIFLNDVRNRLRQIPTIDPEAPTILVAGFPNVGKSSFIIQVTDARPEIASYPFTTQGIFVGHFERGSTRNPIRYQVIDTPGLLDRPMSERNEIERQAVAVLRHLKGVVLFILDPSGHSGFLIEDQLRLVEDIKSWVNLPVFVVANKADIGSDLEVDSGISLGDIPRMSTLTGEGVKETLDVLVSKLLPRSTD